MPQTKDPEAPVGPETNPLRDEALPLRLSNPDALPLEDAAARVAGAAAPTGRPSNTGLLRRARANHQALVEAYEALSLAAKSGEAPSPDAEWLLDNFHIIDEVYREVLTDLPQGYYDELPTQAAGPLAGLPCTYALAAELLARADSAVNDASAAQFVEAYQRVRPLTIGELWSVPIMLRVGLLENLARLARHMQITRGERLAAEGCLRAANSGGPLELPGPAGDAFVIGLLHALRDMQEVRPELDECVRRWLAGVGLEPAEVMRREHRRQASSQVSIGNAVTSLRLLAAVDWASFFERLSAAEAVLRAEPTGYYARQTFATRDACRAAVERLSRGSGVDELEVARRAVALASSRPGAPHQNFVGYYLVGDGLPELERELGYRPRWGDGLKQALLRNPNLTYFGLLLVLVAGLVWGAVALSGAEGWLALAVGAVALLPAAEVAVACVNFLLCRLLPPRVPPRLDFRDGIPAEFATFVVIPTMLTRPDSARGLLERLELHYLANPGPNLYFALLTDFADADGETTPEDEACLRPALEGVAALNARHAAGGPPRFFVLHRRRLFNPGEGKWMGWERKRGKLHEFNRLIRGAVDTSYAVCSSKPDALPRTKFVLTLDSDTVLPRDAARVLVGTLAHPLNAPRLSASGRAVVAGYGILQPRVSFLYRTGLRSLFARLFAYSAGIDPYSSAVSDTYMDLFGRGSFTGKGLYDVDAFEATAGRAFPENSILSHDLIESAFARCALVSDVEVFDDFPARYTAYSRREHRWARGDWQLLPWLMPTVPTAHEGGLANPLPALERWKVADNMRRTLTPAALVLMLALGWTVLPGAAWLWAALALVVLAAPLLLHLVGVGLGLPAVGLRQGWVNARAGLASTAGQAALGVALLGHQAWSLLDAVGRTLWRLVTRRHMLEWETAAATEARLAGTPATFAREMWAGPVVALGLLGLLAWGWPEALPAALPFLAAWLLSPLVAWWVSLPLEVRREEADEAGQALLRRLACKTWGFFEKFVGGEDHWLPPDNYQEGPVEAVAHRTSPTNIGLMLTSALAAHDLGFIALGDLAERVEKALETMGRLERYQGHFLNWYDTKTLAPLPPAYVSTVDSGNLAACLLVLAQGLEEKARATGQSANAARGLRERLLLLHEALGEDEEVKKALAGGLAAPSGDDWGEGLGRLAALAERLRQKAAGDREAERLAGAFAGAVGRMKEEAEAPPGEEMGRRLRRLADTARAYADEMDFGFLFNHQRQLFAIGYHVPRGSLDGAHYDLLASEACLTSFLAVARGEVPRKHWFQLARPFIQVGELPGLLSWGGTMFEYLMPRLLLPVPPGVLLDTAWRAAVAAQVEYGRRTGTAWGISESAYNLTDAAGNYQYQAFGVPGLGLKRGLGNDLVIAPYAAVLAVQVAPGEAVANIRRLMAEGAEGRYGLYEAIDHTPDRLPKGRDRQVIPSYMAHHQGMGLLAIANALLGDVMPARLGREPAVRAVDLLLQERVPLDAPVVENREADAAGPPRQAGPSDAVSRRLTTPTPREPRPHLLSNGRYTVMLTSCGAGYSSCGGVDVTRWRADPTAEAGGQFCYVRDVRTGEVWAAGHQPVCKAPDWYEAIFSVDKAELRRRDGELETLLEVCVSPELDGEVRRVSVVNHSDAPREVELTSYVEVALIGHGADLAHPAFHKLFVQTRWLENSCALMCRRRPRAADQAPAYAVHVLAAEPEEQPCPPEFETDRARFVGRRKGLAAPAALAPGAKLSGTAGAVLDPVLSIRCRLTVPAGGKVSVTYATACAKSEEEAIELAARLRAPQAAGRAFELAWAHSRVELKHFNLSIREAQLYQRLAGQVLFPAQSLRAPAAVLASNRQGQSGLWRHGISGDLPIVALRLADGAEHTELLRRVLAAHAYWHAKGLTTDLVVLNEAHTSYHDEVTREVLGLVRATEDRDRVDRPGGVFIRKVDQFSPDDLALLLSWARVVLSAERGSLEDQVGLAGQPRPVPPEFAPASRRAPLPCPAVEAPAGLSFFNGAGGFSADGREYVVAPGAVPPVPWVNVIANPTFGTLVSDSGSGYTWAGNSQLNRLTPWSNDPVSDPAGEAVYLRDEETGEAWTPTPLPAGRAPTLARHGAGYTVFEQRHNGLAQELVVFVYPDEAVKVSLLRLTNLGDAPRRLTATYYAEWVLGTHRDLTGMHVVTEADDSAGAVLASNPGNPAMAPAVAFAALGPGVVSLTADRTEFLGRNGSMAAPAALGRVGLSRRVGPALDQCAALQAVVDVPPGGSAVVVCLLGQAADAGAARRLIGRLREPGEAEAALAEARRRWDDLLGVVRVRTPEPALDLMVNRWLLYQVVSSRLWGRTGFYQSGGAYGFRDQLQDVMALAHAAPAAAREHILRAAGRQFREGDVQHWWHPPTGHGVRTRFSDDFLWLPLVACHYAEAVGDDAVFDEKVPFLEAPPLGPHEEESYGLPRASPESAPLYEHCLRALEHGWKLGEHGLPLMGIGDWNDGMNKVGAGGKGESVWVAWFQAFCLERFALVADRRDDRPRAELCRQRAAQLRKAAEEAWDGEWYRRAYFDDGTPLGSAQNTECRIDSLAQSWAVIAGGEPGRAKQAFDEAVRQLVKFDERLVLLFDPPFDDGPLHPGYIKGYVPGTRENGGQYTHAAMWLVQAAALLRRGELAGELLSLLNPVLHCDTAEKLATYKGEPYVVAADVYGRPPHVGRAGWTWYTGSAGWFYQVALGDVLGVRRAGKRLTFAPCLPPSWRGFEASYRHGGTAYEIVVERGEVAGVEVDGAPAEGGGVELVDDGRTRRVLVRVAAG